MAWTTQSIAQLVGGRLSGPADLVIEAMESVEQARPGHLTYVTSEKYARLWASSNASAALVPLDLAVECPPGKAVVAVANVELAVAAILSAMAPEPVLPEPGVHPTAHVEASATVDPAARIGPHCHVGRRVIIGPRTVLHAHVSVHDDSKIGRECVIWSGAVLRERTKIGDRTVIHPNATIGADGFGYRPAADGRSLVKIPQIGGVTIGNDVEIGANTCIDRGKFTDTVVGDGSKLDNLIQVAHNVVIGRCVVIAGCCGIAGSVRIEDGVVIGAGAGFKDHIVIGAGAKVAAYAAVMNDVPPGEEWAGYPAQNAKMAMREILAVRKLPEMLRQMKRSDRT
jgi:UDP-3-O-[3-hydroxymyristoyl] glucosamine N-acyltransferase